MPRLIQHGTLLLSYRFTHCQERPKDCGTPFSYWDWGAGYSGFTVRLKVKLKLFLGEITLVALRYFPWTYTCRNCWPKPGLESQIHSML